MPKLTERQRELLDDLRLPAIVLDPADGLAVDMETGLRRCEICGDMVYVGNGKYGFSVYTTTERGAKFATTRSRKHFPNSCDLAAWMAAGVEKLNQEA